MATARPRATRIRTFALVLGLGVAAALAGCRESTPQITGLRVFTNWPSALRPVQLAFVFSADNESVGSRQVRPEMPRGPLTNGIDLVVYLPDRYAGRTIRIDVDALGAGELVLARTARTVSVEKNVVKTVIVDFGGTGDGGADGPIVSGTDRPNGATCTANNQCRSDFCVDGVCCATSCNALCRACNVAGSEGTCSPAPEGSDDGGCGVQPPESCGFDGTCDGRGACRKYPSGVRCGEGVCSGSSITAGSSCDGTGNCVAGAAVPCAPFACSVADGAPRCNPSCQDGAGCVSGVMCVAGSCGPRLDGASCVQDVDCQSGHCVGGTCCNTRCDEACFSCRLPGSLGSCRPVPAGTKEPMGRCADTGAAGCGFNGRCDGRGACSKYPPGTICQPANCNSDNLLVAASRCDGLGSCKQGGSVNCAPFQCKSGACTGSCQTAADCTGEAPACLNGSCGPKGLGQPCSDAGQCASGICSDGVCCDEACAGACRTCAAGPQPGRCSLIAAGGADTRGMCIAQPPASCATDGTCDGAGGCHKYPAGTVCGGGACNPATNMRRLPSTCDASGACVAGANASCGPYRCNGTGCFTACGRDEDCQPPNVCQGGSCGLRVGGAACTAGNECASGFCTDGVCCEAAACGTCQACNLPGSAGVCSSVAAGIPDPRGRCTATTPGTCGDDGVCDGAGACRKHPAGTTCGTPRCSADGLGLILAPQCDGRGMCVTGNPQACAPYRCDSTTNACRTTCSSPADCAAPNLCSVNGSCGNVKALGRTCTAASECASGFCTNGYCCESASCSSCHACNVSGRQGTCAPVPAGADDPARACVAESAATCGRDGKCDGNGGCRRHVAGTTCRAGSCSGSVATPPSTCNGSGTCQMPATRSCGAYLCQSGGTCPTTCRNDSECVSPNTCNSSTCRLKSQGASCTSNAQCGTGFCTNGVCCNMGSCGRCRACNVSGFVGFCKEVPAGAADPSGMCQPTSASSCGTDGRCDGAGGCRLHAAGTVCQPASCQGSTFLRQDVCNGQGSCTDGGSTNCFPYLCNSGSAGCFTSCSSDVQCATSCREFFGECR